jgi:hypothetical protein
VGLGKVLFDASHPRSSDVAAGLAGFRVGLGASTFAGFRAQPGARFNQMALGDYLGRHLQPGLPLRSHQRVGRPEAWIHPNIEHFRLI